MRTTLVLILFCLGGCAPPGSSATTTTPTSQPPAERVVLPDVAVQSLEGKTFSLTGLTRGHVVVVDLWATWCKACEVEHPKLVRLARGYASKKLLVLGIDVGEEREVVESYLGRRDFGYPVFLDPDFALPDALGEKELPLLLVVDTNGGIAHRSDELDERTLAVVRRVLAE